MVRDDAIGEQTVAPFTGYDPPNSLPAWIYDRLRGGRFAVCHNISPSFRLVMEWNE